MTDLLKSLSTGARHVLLSASVIAAALFVGVLVYLLVFAVLRRIVARTASDTDNAIVETSRGPGRVIVPLLAMFATLPLAQLSAPLYEVVRRVCSVALIASVAWLLVRLCHVVIAAWMAHYDIAASDNLASRKVVTQLRLLSRFATMVILVVAAAAILMTFDRVRQLGTSLLASAGIAGIVLGIAAQRTLGNFVAGIQIAITQPIRLDDVVIVENEWGRIEEITLTYVVVRIWDERRLIVPISYFVEKPFQNWTRTSAELLGTVTLQCDFSVGVDALRQELQRIVEASPLWDQRLAMVQVTETSERTMTVRALISAADSSHAWDLRCEVREKLLAFVEREQASALPRVRSEVRAHVAVDSKGAA